MTICIAAIHNDGGIVGVSDRMIAMDDMAFEPKGTSKKIFCLDDGIFALNAGHVGIQAEIMETMQSICNAGRSKNPKKKFTVAGMVDLYVKCHADLKRKRLNDAVFSLWNLDETSFLARQKEFSDVFVGEIMRQVSQFQFPDVCSIIAGVDKITGRVEPHIYCIKKGYYQNSVECCDAAGYSTIGSGAHHVESYFMFSQFTRHFSMPKTVALCYFAKRRAELAPTVGKETDMLLIGPTLGFNRNLDGVLDYTDLNRMNDDINDNERQCVKWAFQKLFDDLKGKLPTMPSSHD